MTHRKGDTFKTFRFCILGLPLVLAACHSDFGPFPMPSGYEHHQKEHKAPPGPEPVYKTLETRWRAGNDQAVMAPAPVSDDEMGNYDDVPSVAPEKPAASYKQASSSSDMTGHKEEWRSAANDLVRGLLDNFGQPTEPVFVKTPVSPTGTEMHFEKALRQALRDQGVSLAAARGLSPFVVEYEISNLGATGRDRVMAAVKMLSAGNIVAEESGIYDVGYGSIMKSPGAPHTHSGPSMSGAPPTSIIPE